MQSAQFNAYVSDVISFTRSLCVKSEQNIELQNDYLKALGYTIGEDKRTWKYYLNLAGEYHITDEPMQILSSDTQSTVPFTKESLKDHPLSRIEYGAGGIYHEALLEEYPSQRDLIARILDPVDMDRAIAADDFTILAHSGRFLSAREYTLIPDLQRWLYDYNARWNVSSYAITDPLYPAALQGVMWQAIPGVIMNLQLERCFTAEVSDFHLWSYLGGKYRLDRYRNALDTKQALFLYRNINYLRKHVGKEKTIHLLQSNLTEPVNILSTKYDVTQNDSTLIVDRKPDPVLLRSPYKARDPSVSVEDRLAIAHATDLSRNSAIYNEEDYHRDTVHAEKLVQSDVIDTVPTGLIELSVKHSDPEVRANPAQLKIQHWLYMAATGRYNAAFKIPFGSYGDVAITAKEGAILFQYCLLKLYPEFTPSELANNLTIEDREISDITVTDVLPLTLPPLNRLRGRLTTPLINAGYAEKIHELGLTLPLITERSELDQLVSDIVETHYQQYLIAATSNSVAERSYVSDAVDLMYVSKTVSFYPDGVPETYGTWLRRLRLDEYTLTDADFLSIIHVLLSNIAGLDLDDAGRDNKYASLVEILKLLSSYSLLFVNGANVKTALPMELGAVFPSTSGVSILNRFPLNMGLVGGRSGGRYYGKAARAITGLILESKTNKAVDPVTTLAVDGLYIALSTGTLNSPTNDNGLLARVDMSTVPVDGLYRISFTPKPNT